MCVDRYSQDGSAKVRVPVLPGRADEAGNY